MDATIKHCSATTTDQDFNCFDILVFFHAFLSLVSLPQDGPEPLKGDFVAFKASGLLAWLLELKLGHSGDGDDIDSGDGFLSVQPPIGFSIENKYLVQVTLLY